MTPSGSATCAHHDSMLHSRTFWSILGILIAIIGAIFGTMWSSVAADIDTVDQRNASNDRVNGVERRIDDTREEMRTRFDKVDYRQEKMDDKLDNIETLIRAAAK